MFLAAAGFALLAAVAAAWFLRSELQQPVAVRTADQDSSAAEPDHALRAIQTSAQLPTPVVQDHTEVEIPPETDAAIEQQLDAVGHVVWGYVLDDGGHPLASASRAGIRFVDELGASQLATIDAEGAYSTPGLATGRWYLTAGASGRKASEATLDLTDDAATVRQDFQLSPQPCVRVRLIGPAGHPFWEEAKGTDLPPFLGLELLAVATSQPPGERFEEVVGSANNPFGVGQLWFNGQSDVRLGAEYLGRIDLAVDPPVYVSLVLYHDVVETQRLAAGEDEVTFTLDPATLAARLGGVEFTVVDAKTSAPIEGAQVMLRVKGQSGPSQASNAEGHVLFDAQMPGLYELSVAAEGRAAVRREVDVPRGRRADLGRIALDIPVPIRGRAVDGNGRGFAVELRVEPLPTPGQPLGLPTFRSLSQSDGSFEIASQPPGIWLLQAKDRKEGRDSGNAAELMSPNLVVDTRAGPVDDLRVQLEPVSAVVARWTGELSGHLRMRFFDEHGYWRQSAGFSNGAPVRVDLLPGCWRIVVSNAAGATLSERFFTLGTEPIVLELKPDR